MSIHVVEIRGDGGLSGFQVWTDCERYSECDGRIVGLGETRYAALRNARLELQAELERVQTLIENEIVGGKAEP